MIHITQKENMVLNQIKYFQNEYKEGVPYRILKLDLDLSEMDLKDILKTLDQKGIVDYQDGTVTLLEKGIINVLESKEDVKKEELNQTEIKAFELIQEVAGESGLISRSILEGLMLYGELKLTSLKTYNMIIALENKSLIKKIQLADGEYYTLNF
jgi:Mn-dependent DtxR family transcriptional regulator